MTYVYESLALVVFILISLVFIKPPVRLMRFLESVLNRVDRWL